MRRILTSLVAGAALAVAGCTVYEPGPPAYAYAGPSYYAPGYYAYPSRSYVVIGGHGHHHRHGHRHKHRHW
jgi:hypothetical protein